MKKYRKPSMLGASLDLLPNTPLITTRQRSLGILTTGELGVCRAQGITLAFDPMQQGWVTQDCEDDLTFAPQADIAPMRGGNSSVYARTAPLSAKRYTTPVYRLRAWGSSDVNSYIDLLNDPDVWQYLPEDYPDPLTEELASVLIELSNASNHHQVRAVERNGTPVGQVRLEYGVEPNNPACAEISYWLGKEYWGQGIGSDVVKLFSARSFRDNLTLTSLIANVHRKNQASLGVLAKAGYVVEGSDHQRADWIKLRLARD